MLKKDWETPFENLPPNSGSIEFVGTAIEFRGQGVASQIIRHILENDQYNDYVIAEVADTNIPAIKLYEKWVLKNIKESLFQKRAPRKVESIITCHLNRGNSKDGW
ncbi:GNAT family N-acetyltransferase [Lederbergia galactosidilytica]|uniref:GNAT family N-acetyltransferase n=1 Tax=Lederbergia galactosidilytica TaxID=217031 RepID=UPI00308436C1